MNSPHEVIELKEKKGECKIGNLSFTKKEDKNKVIKSEK